MPKSLGNVVDPLTIINDTFAGDPDPLRYFLLRTGRIDADGQFGMDALKECYERELVGSLGNLISRVFKANSATEAMNEEETDFKEPADPQISDAIHQFREQVAKHFDNVKLSGVADCLQGLLGSGNAFLSRWQPWKEPSRWPHCRHTISALLQAALPVIGSFTPGAAVKIESILRAGQPVRPGGIFPRLGPPL